MDHKYRHTLYIFHENGYYNIHPYTRKCIGAYDCISVPEDVNIYVRIFKWNRYYWMQNGKKAAFITKVWKWGPGMPREIQLNASYMKIMCFILNRLPYSLRRKRNWWFGL